MDMILATGSEPSTFSSNPLAATLIVGGVAIIAIIMMLATRRNLMARAGARPSARERLDELKAQARSRDEAGGREAQMVNLAQDLAARLDSKAARIEALIEEAQRTIDALQLTIAEAESTSAAAQAEAPLIMTQAMESKPQIPRDPLTVSVYELADAGHAPVEIAQRLDEQVGKVELILALRGGG